MKFNPTEFVKTISAYDNINQICDKLQKQFCIYLQNPYKLINYFEIIDVEIISNVVYRSENHRKNIINRAKGVRITYYDDPNYYRQISTQFNHIISYSNTDIISNNKIRQFHKNDYLFTLMALMHMLKIQQRQITLKDHFSREMKIIRINSNS